MNSVCPQPKARRFPLFQPGVAVATAFLAGCVTVSRGPRPPLKLLSSDEIPQFVDGLPKETLAPALQNSMDYFEAQALKPSQKFYRIGDFIVTPQHMAESLQEFQKIYQESKDPAELTRRIADEFYVYESNGGDGQGNVTFSGYYELTLPASLKKTLEYPYPIYKRPPDLVEIRLEDFDPKWKGQTLMGRVEAGRLVPYFNRKEIDFEKALAGKNLEIAWLQNRLDVADLHIQGSGRLVFPDGTQMRASFAATNGLGFKSPPTVLVAAGAIPKDEFTYERARQYLKAHPEIAPFVLSSDKRYTFYKLTPIQEGEGPIGTLQFPVTPGRSVAVDPDVVPLGLVAFLSTNLPSVSEEGTLLGLKPSSRFVLCQDTGGAIKGPGRADLFLGHGKQAQVMARNLWETGHLYLLVKKFPSRSR